MEGRGQVYGNDRVPAGGRKILDRRYILNAGIVDEDIDLSETLGCVRDHRLDHLGFRHVGAVVVDIDIVLARQGAGYRLNLAALAEAIEQDRSALAGQLGGDAETDAAGRPGDDGGAPVERAAPCCRDFGKARK